MVGPPMSARIDAQASVPRCSPQIVTLRECNTEIKSKWASPRGGQLLAKDLEGLGEENRR